MADPFGDWACLSSDDGYGPDCPFVGCADDDLGEGAEGYDCWTVFADGGGEGDAEGVCLIFFFSSSFSFFSFSLFLFSFFLSKNCLFLEGLFVVMFYF